MKNVYLALSIAGAIVPYVFFVRFFTSGDASPGAFLSRMFANDPARGLTADLMISSVVFWIWSYGETRRRRMSAWWPYVAVNLTIGLSCALPLFLFMRERSADTA